MSTSPLDLHQNIDWYRNNYPLEYQELVHDWCLKFDYSLFGNLIILSKDIHIFSYSQTSEKSAYRISFIHGDSYIDLESEDSYCYNGSMKYRSTEKTWLKPLTIPDIQSMLGILTFSETLIQFVNRSLK